MHEFSIASGILDTIQSNVPDPLKLTLVRITATSLSGISFDSLMFCFNELCASKGYVNAKLEINSEVVIMKCIQCDKEYSCTFLDEVCPACGSQERVVLSGSTFNIDYIEIEE